MSLKKIVLLFLFVSHFPCLQAQQSELPKDSLLTIIESHTSRDSVRVNALIDIQAYYLVDKHERGLTYIQEAIEISEEIKYKTGEGFSRNALGAYYLRQGENEKAIQQTLAAIEIFEEIGEDQNIYASFNNLALLYKRLEKYQEAVEVYKDMLDRLEGRPKSPSFVVVYFNLASTYQAMEDLDKYKFWLNNMLDLAEELNFPLGIIESRLGLAQLAIQNEEYKRGLELSLSSLPQIKQMGMAQPEARAHKVAAAGYHAQDKFTNALDHIMQSRMIYEKINDLTQLAEVYRLQSNIYESLGEFESALVSNKKYHTLQDSLLSEERKATIEELQTKYETERIQREKDKAELENLKLADENRKTRNLLLGSLGLILFISLTGFGYNRQQKLKQEAEMTELELKETQKRLSIEQQKRQAELKAVRSQLNPHFIFNLMNSVQELTLQNDSEKAANAMGLMSSLMRKTLAHSREDLIPLKEELELTKLYLEAEQLRFEDHLQFNFVIAEEVETEFIDIPPKLIQPYVENAVKHGLLHKIAASTKGEILVQLALTDDDQLTIIIRDNGMGREKAETLKTQRPGKHNSFSTSANEERLKNIAEEIGRPADITYSDLLDDNGDAAGTQVTIHFPIQV